MYLKVIKAYADRLSEKKDIVEKGTILRGVEEDRAQELLAAGVAEEIIRPAKKPKKEQ